MRPHWLLALSLLTGCETPVNGAALAEWLATPAPQPTRAAPVTATAALPAPEGLTTISGELREIPLHWRPLLLSEVDGYVVERADEREGPYRQVAQINGRSQTAWVDRGPGLVAAATPGGAKPLGDGETHFYRVRPRTQSGALGAEASEPVPGTTIAAPDAPDDLRAYSHQPRNVPLSWRASTAPTVAGYIVERSPTSRGPFEELAEIDDRFETVYVDRDLGDLRVFHYRIRSVNQAGGRGEPSQPIRAVTKPEPLPPVGLHVTAQRLGTNELAWLPNVEPDLAGYRLLRRRRGDTGDRVVAELDAGETRVLDTGLGAGEPVTYRLRAIDSDGLESDLSGGVEVIGTGYELEVTARPEGNVLSWRGRAEEGWTRARIFAIGALGTTELGSASGNRFIHAGVEAGTRYRYRVVLERSDGTRAPESQIVEVDVPSR